MPNSNRGSVIPVLLLGALAVLLGSVALYQRGLLTVSSSLLQALPQLQFLEHVEISTPGPLRGALNQRGTPLTRAGILVETNRHRAENDRAPLTENNQLHQAAEAKLRDMERQQYFEHVGPDGRGPSNWVDDTGYTYLRVGENLALGNFDGDAAVTQAWMDSPGHRENMLSPRFNQIGIAAAEVTFEGRRTWLAVQTFALPRSACPSPNSSLEKRFESLAQQLAAKNNALDPQEQIIDRTQAELTALRADIDHLVNEGNAKVAEGNRKVEQGNRVYQETGSREQAQPYWNDGERFQEEGKALLEQARQQQADYAQQVEAFNVLRDAYNAEVEKLQALQAEAKTVSEQLNQQIRAFNTCLEK